MAMKDIDECSEEVSNRQSSMNVELVVERGASNSLNNESVLERGRHPRSITP